MSCFKPGLEFDAPELRRDDCISTNFVLEYSRDGSARSLVSLLYYALGLPDSWRFVQAYGMMTRL